jgi:hypothetical protein
MFLEGRQEDGRLESECKIFLGEIGKGLQDTV